MRRFTKNDWYAFAGAEKFEDGREPLIGEYGDLVVIHDASGIQAIVADYENEFFQVESKNYEYCQTIAEFILSAVEGMTPREMVDYLNTL